MASAKAKNCRFSDFSCPFLSTTLPLHSTMKYLSHFTREASVWRALTNFITEVCLRLSKSTCVLLSDCSGSQTFISKDLQCLKGGHLCLLCIYKPVKGAHRWAAGDMFQSKLYWPGRHDENEKSKARHGCWVPSEHALRCETWPSSPHSQEKNAEGRDGPKKSSV